MSNLIKISYGKGDNIWAGYKMFRLYHDHNGNLFPTGAKFVVFDEGAMVGAYSTETEANAGFMRGDRVEGVRLSEYKGIAECLR